MQVRILHTDRPRIPGEGSSALGKSGPKARLKSVVDGQQVEIPVPIQSLKEVGTQEDNKSAQLVRRASAKSGE